MLPVHKKCQESLVCLSPEESGKSKNFLLGLLGFLASFQSPLCQSLTFLQEQLSTIAEPTASLCCPPRTPAFALVLKPPFFHRTSQFDSLTQQQTNSDKNSKKNYFKQSGLFRDQASVRAAAGLGQAVQAEGLGQGRQQQRTGVALSTTTSHRDSRGLSSDWTGRNHSFCHHYLLSSYNNTVSYF